MIKTGLIGFGLAGRNFHAKLIAACPLLELAAVVTTRADEVAAAFPYARIVASPEALLADPNIGLVVIATPNDSHVPLAQAALAAGKHVVVDKPLAPSAADAEALVGMAERAGRLLVPFHNRRWDTDFLTARRLIEDGLLGRIVLAEMRMDRFRPTIREVWRERPGAGAGVLADLAPHLLDQAVSLFGLPDALDADVAAQRDGVLVDDYFEIVLRYGQARVVCSGSTLIAAPRPRLALYGDRGSFIKKGPDMQDSALCADGQPTDAGFGEERESEWGVYRDGSGNDKAVPSVRGNWGAFYQGVAEAIFDGVVPPVAASDAIVGLRLIEAARRSAETGRRQVFSGAELSRLAL